MGSWCLECCRRGKDDGGSGQDVVQGAVGEAGVAAGYEDEGRRGGKGCEGSGCGTATWGNTACSVCSSNSTGDNRENAATLS